MESNPQIIVLVGIPGSGKSTIARYIAANIPECVIVESDAIRFSLWNKPTHSTHENAMVFDIVKQRINDCLDKGKVALVDATSVSKRTRKDYLHIAKKRGVRVDAVFVDISLDTCLGRNKGRGKRTVPEYAIRAAYDRLNPPTTEEGFAAVHVIKESKIGENVIRFFDEQTD